MKLQRTFICIVGVFFAVGFAASQAGAGVPGGTPGCSSIDPDTDEGVPGMKIEINALRAGAKTVVTSPNDTTKVTSKARILKGTAFKGTTLVTTLRIDTMVDGGIVSTAEQTGITLGVGKGGKGASLLLDTEVCSGTGNLTFVATFFGLDVDGDLCTETINLKKACR